MRTVTASNVVLDERTLSKLDRIANDPFMIDNAADALIDYPNLQMDTKSDVLYLTQIKGLVFQNRNKGVVALHGGKFVCEFKSVSSVLDVSIMHMHTAASLAGIQLHSRVDIAINSTNDEIMIS